MRGGRRAHVRAVQRGVSVRACHACEQAPSLFSRTVFSRAFNHPFY